MQDRLLGVSTTEIVTGIRAGDQYLFSALFTAYWGPMCRVAFAMLQNRADAEDVVARILASLWQRRTSFHVDGTIHGYLAQAVRNQVRKLWRDVGVRGRLLERYVEPGESPAMGNTNLDEFSSSKDEMNAELLMAADVAIESLHERYRVALRYRWYEQLEYDEIARIMKVSPGAARILVSRGIKQLKQILLDGESDNFDSARSE